MAVIETSSIVAGEPPKENQRVASWAAAPQIPYYLNDDNPTRQTFSDQTIRQIVHVGLGGKQVSVRFTNEFGTKPLEIGSAQVAVRSDGAGTVPSTNRTLTFGQQGQPSIKIPPGGTGVSNPVDLTVQSGSDLAISTYLPAKQVAGTTEHRQGLKTYVSEPGDHTSASSMRPVKTLKAWYFLSRVDVNLSPGKRTIVAMGDSLTDYSNELDPEKKDTRWPDVLQKRLRAAGQDVSVVNMGISGSRLLHNTPEAKVSTRDKGLDRFERDVLTQPGITDAIVLLGTNDLGRPGKLAPASEEVTSSQFITGLKALINKAHARHIRIIGSTIPPMEGSTFGFFTPDREKRRQEINEWIKTSGKFDGVADFDHALRDPAHHSQLREVYDSGDHTHPNDQGEEAMGMAINLATLTKTGIPQCCAGDVNAELNTAGKAPAATIK